MKNSTGQQQIRENKIKCECQNSKKYHNLRIKIVSLTSNVGKK